MNNYVYDGSFEGLLTAIYDSYYRHETPDNIIHKKECSQICIFEQNYSVFTDIEKFTKVYASIKEKISTQALKNIYYVFISDSYGKEKIIYNYLKLGWKIGRDIDRLITDDNVLKVKIISRKVTTECHRMLGILRFKLMEGNYYYASFEPDHNIISLLAPHFAKRLSDQKWVLHDLKRKTAAIFDTEGWFLSPIDALQELRLSDKENDFQNLWKLYFKNISIKSRTNLKLQRKYMPKRYWAHIVEMDQQFFT